MSNVSAQSYSYFQSLPLATIDGSHANIQVGDFLSSCLGFILCSAHISASKRNYYKTIATRLLRVVAQVRGRGAKVSRRHDMGLVMSNPNHPSQSACVSGCEEEVQPCS